MVKNGITYSGHIFLIMHKYLKQLWNVTLLIEPEKGFQKKPIVAFTNSTVLHSIDIRLQYTQYITKLVRSYGLPLSARTLNKAHIVSCQKASAQITNICMQGKFLTN